MTKIDIVSGFLGAGKTTLIKKLLAEALSGTKVVLIENEFGQIGIDGGFLKDSGIEVKEMNSGCICCSLVGDFGASLEEVLETYHPERIMIEPSGVGKLSDVTKAVLSVAEKTDSVLGSAVAVVDASKCKLYAKNFGEFFLDQIEHASVILLSRTAQMGKEKMDQAVSVIREHNKDAVVITTPWDELEGSQILNTMEQNVSLKEELLEEVKHHHHDHEHHHDHDHHADEVFTSWGLETVAHYTDKEIEDALTALENADQYGMVLRAKGMVAGADGEWIYFDYVPGEKSVRNGQPDVAGRLCVIGSELNEDALKELFDK